MIKYCSTKLVEHENKTYYWHIFPSIGQVKMCYSKKVPIFKIDVSEARPDENSPYYGWLNNEGNISMIYPNFLMFDMCFTYGSAAEEKAGRGKVIKVAIKELERIE